MGVDDLSDSELSRAEARGEWGATGEMARRRETRRESERGEVSRGPNDGAIGCIIALAIPVFAIYFIYKGVLVGMSALANESLLASFFPRPGDSVARFIASLATLELLIPGSVLLVARLLKGTRLDPARRFLLLPLAFVLVAVVAASTVWTITTGTVRLAS